MTGKLSKNFHGVGIGPFSKILAVKYLNSIITRRHVASGGASYTWGQKSGGEGASSKGGNPLMMSQKWFEFPFNLSLENMMGASYYVLAPAEGSTQEAPIIIY